MQGCLAKRQRRLEVLPATSVRIMWDAASHPSVTLLGSVGSLMAPGKKKSSSRPRVAKAAPAKVAERAIPASSDHRLTLRVWNFRNLLHLEWSPSGVCLLGGPNGSGKSTTLDAFLFLRVLFERGHEAAFQRVGARYFRSTSVPESEPVVFELDAGSVRWKLRFPMASAGLKDTYGEELYHQGRLVLRAAMFQQSWNLGTDRLPLDDVRCCAKVLWDRGDAGWMKPFADAVGAIQVYDSYWLPQVERSEPVEPRQSILHGSGANLWSVLSNWKSAPIASKGRFEWVMSAARKAFPDQISTIEFEGGFPLLFPPGASGPESGLPPERAADGLLTGLLHLTAVAGARPGSLVAIDEMENQLHPHAIRSLLSSMRARAEEDDLTIIVTTHSPVVMNNFREEPEKVFVLDRSEPRRPVPIPITELHSEDWLAQAKLGSLYERLAFGSPPVPG